MVVFDLLASFCTTTLGAGLGATEEEAVEAEGGREATRFVGDLARPPPIISAFSVLKHF